jgi:hypothetical protein
MKTKQPKAAPENFLKTYRFPLLVLLLVPFLLYGYSITFTEYVLDDALVLSENNFVKKGFAGIWDILANETFTGFLGTQQNLVEGARYRPLSLVTFAVEYGFLGLNPQVSHFINVLLYALSALLLLRVLALFFPLEKNANAFYSIPFVATLLFVLHPVHTEVVANIKSRDEILCLLFSLATLYYSFRFVSTDNKLNAVASALFFLLAMLSKENAITFLAVVPLCIYFFTQLPTKKIIASIIPLAVTTVIYLIIRSNVLGFLFDSGKEVALLMNNPFLGTTQDEKFATIFYTLLLYIKLLFFPHPLTHDYYPYHIPIIEWSDPRAFLSLILYMALIVFAFRNFRNKSVVAFCILFFVVTISIVSNMFFAVGVFMAERFLYMPSVAFCLLIAYWCIHSVVQYEKRFPAVNYIAAILLVIFISGFSYKTIERVPVWKDTMSLNKSGAEVSVNSARAQQYYGYALYVEATKEKDRTKKQQLLDEALPYVNRALKIHPVYTDALTCKAGIVAAYYQLDGDLDKLLNEFYRIQLTNPVPFVDQYLNYLDNRADSGKLRNFYLNLGNALSQKGNRQKGNYYLNKAK